ncbi:MAG: methyltransferase domain-containing protein [Polyangiaceae bacterium]
MVGIGSPRIERVRSASAFWSARAKQFDGYYELKHWWDHLLHRPLQIRHDAAMAMVHSLHAPVVCDVGCGSGRQLEAALEAGASRGVGIDVSAEMVRLARDRLVRSGCAERVSIHTGDVLDWQPEEQFDLVWALGVFDYEKTPGPLLKKLHSLSRGHALFTFRRAWAFRSPFRKLTYQLRGQPIYLHTRWSIRSELRAAGFHDIWVERLTAGLYLARARTAPTRVAE